MNLVNKNIETFKRKYNLLEKEIWNAYYVENSLSEPILDGIVSIEQYLNSKYRILWILKEPYDEHDGSGGGWHLVRDFRKDNNNNYQFGRSHSTWHPIIYVCYSILNTFLKYEDMNWIRDYPEMTKILNQIAIINIKKTPGFTRTRNNNQILENFNKHKSLLFKQLELYKPDIIIGGSTLKHFFNEMGISLDSLGNNGCVWHYQMREKLYISTYHPAQSTVTREIYVNEIVSTIENLLKNRDNNNLKQ